jgi:hypothetical protein
MKRRPAAARRAAVVAAVVATASSILVGTAEAKPSAACTQAVASLNRVSQRIGFARADGDTAEMMFWQSEYGPQKVYASSACGWGDVPEDPSGAELGRPGGRK